MLMVSGREEEKRSAAFLDHRSSSGGLQPKGVGALFSASWVAPPPILHLKIDRQIMLKRNLFCRAHNLI